MKSSNKIMDSFEEFIALPLSILKNRIIQITGFKSDFISTKSIDVELSDDTIRINCVNNENAYNLLSTVIYKREQRRKALLAKQKEENKDLLAIVKG
ncbi:MAG: hypothetical protein IJW73_01135 [Candidatus Gastranaerophilales bacterium]|nr:hypothetical protein [Candidatus Gastranaerophilales bacterium]